LDQKRAEEFKTRATKEATSALRIKAVEASLQAGDLKQARMELDQVWTESVEYPMIKRKYDLAEDEAIFDLVTQLGRVKDNSCERYGHLLAKERNTKAPRVIAEATRRVACTPLPKCNARDLAERGRQLLDASRFLESLTSYEAAYACDPGPRWSEKALIAACYAGHLLKAKSHWGRLPYGMRLRSLGICEANRITAKMLNEP
jgi:hypothetical protein